MALAAQLADYIHAAFTGLYLETHEPEEALREIQDLCRQRAWAVAVWDIDRGLTLPGQAEPVTSAADPLAAIRSLPALGTPEAPSLLVLKNFPRFLNSAEIIQALQHQLEAGKLTKTFVVILAPTVQLPIELARQFVILQHDLPDRGQLGAIARETVADRPDDVPTGRDWEALLDASAGLTRQEAEGAFAL